MKSLRIIHVLEASAGGSGLQVRRLAAAQAAAGHLVTLVASDQRSDPDYENQAETLRANGVELVLMPMARRPHFRDLGLILRLRRLLRDRRPDVVHTHCAKAGLLGRLAVPRKAQVSCWHTPHSWYLHGLSGFGRRIAIGLERFLAARSTGLACIAAEEAADAKRWRLAPATKIAVVDNGLPINFADDLVSQSAARQALDLPLDAPVIGAFARLEARKRLEQLILCLPHLPKETLLALVGTGSDQPRLARIAAELGLADRVRFCGYVAEASRLLRALDVAALPSAWEGRSLFALEALAAGVPLVASAAPGNRFAADYGARLVPADDLAAWTTACTEAIAAGPQSPQAMPSIADQAKQFCELYGQAASTIATDAAGKWRYGTLTKPTRAESS